MSDLSINLNIDLKSIIKASMNEEQKFELLMWLMDHLNVKEINKELINKVKDLVSNVEFDLNEPLKKEDE
jgi:hypothetical protein